MNKDERKFIEIKKENEESFFKECLNNSFAKVFLSGLMMDVNLTPYRSVAIDFNMESLADAKDGLSEDYFFRELGKKIWNILQKEEVL